MNKPRKGTMTNFTADLSAASTKFEHVWEHTVGSDHAPMGLRADWQAQLQQCHRELGFRHVRFHGLLSDQMGTLICQNEELLYSFFNADQIMDFLLSIGMRPFVELSFMPETLASGRQTVFRYQGNVTPPQDYDQWSGSSKYGTSQTSITFGPGRKMITSSYTATQSRPSSV
jgi:xylan 1,4-beta-xylosidase